MKEFIRSNFLRSRIIAGVECVLNSVDELEFRYVILQRKKGKVVIQSFAEGIKNEKELFEKIPSFIPICFTLNGKNIVHKKLEIFNEQADAALLQKIFPGAQLNDFYLQKKIMPDEGTLFVSVVRKSILDDLLNQFINHNYSILNCSLGPFSVEEILALLPPELSDGNEFSFDRFTLKLTQNKISDFIQNEPSSSLSKAIPLSSGPLDEKLLISFSSAFEYFIDGHNVSVHNDSSSQWKEEYSQKRQFQLYGWSSMVFFFLLLLLNYFLFEHYSTVKEKYQNEIALNQGYVKEYESLQKEILEKQKFIEATGLLEASRTSYYADQVAIDLPYSILLTDLNIQPAGKKSLAEEDKIYFTPKVISVSGSCKKSYELNEWVKILSKKNWLKDVSIINYRQDNEDGLGKFTLEVHIK